MHLASPGEASFRNLDSSSLLNPYKGAREGKRVAKRNEPPSLASTSIPLLSLLLPVPERRGKTNTFSVLEDIIALVHMSCPSDRHRLLAGSGLRVLWNEVSVEAGAEFVGIDKFVGVDCRWNPLARSPIIDKFVGLEFVGIEKFVGQNCCWNEVFRGLRFPVRGPRRIITSLSRVDTCMPGRLGE